MKARRSSDKAGRHPGRRDHQQHADHEQQAAAEKAPEREVDRKRSAAMAAGAGRLIGAAARAALPAARAPPGNRPGISPAFCQPAMPSLQTSVSGLTVPRAIKSRNWASG